MTTKDNYIFFTDDEEFYSFAVDPRLVVRQGKVCLYTDFDFTPQYVKAVEDGKKFVIMDENSQIEKHNAVSYRTITKCVSNLEPYNRHLHIL